MNGYLVLLFVLLLLNIVSFALMGIDKSKAKRGKWRIPEKALFISCALFGGLGGCLGMYLFRHKTNHWYFALFFPVFLIAQVVILAYLYFSVLR